MPTRALARVSIWLSHGIVQPGRDAAGDVRCRVRCVGLGLLLTLVRNRLYATVRWRF